MLRPGGLLPARAHTAFLQSAPSAAEDVLRLCVVLDEKGPCSVVMSHACLSLLAVRAERRPRHAGRPAAGRYLAGPEGHHEETLFGPSEQLTPPAQHFDVGFQARRAAPGSGQRRTPRVPGRMDGHEVTEGARQSGMLRRRPCPGRRRGLGPDAARLPAGTARVPIPWREASEGFLCTVPWTPPWYCSSRG